MMGRYLGVSMHIFIVQDMEKWPSLMNTIMKLVVVYNAGEFLAS
jgi:hypothetical protein